MSIYCSPTHEYIIDERIYDYTRTSYVLNSLSAVDNNHCEYCKKSVCPMMTIPYTKQTDPLGHHDLGRHPLVHHLYVHSICVDRLVPPEYQSNPEEDYVALPPDIDYYSDIMNRVYYLREIHKRLHYESDDHFIQHSFYPSMVCYVCQKILRPTLTVMSREVVMTTNHERNGIPFYPIQIIPMNIRVWHSDCFLEHRMRLVEPFDLLNPTSFDMYHIIGRCMRHTTNHYFRRLQIQCHFLQILHSMIHQIRTIDSSRRHFFQTPPDQMMSQGKKQIDWIMSRNLYSYLKRLPDDTSTVSSFGSYVLSLDFLLRVRLFAIFTHDRHEPAKEWVDVFPDDMKVSELKKALDNHLGSIIHTIQSKYNRLLDYTIAHNKLKQSANEMVYIPVYHCYAQCEMGKQWIRINGMIKNRLSGSSCMRLSRLTGYTTLSNVSSEQLYLHLRHHICNFQDANTWLENCTLPILDGIQTIVRPFTFSFEWDEQMHVILTHKSRIVRYGHELVRTFTLIPCNTILTPFLAGCPFFVEGEETDIESIYNECIHYFQRFSNVLHSYQNLSFFQWWQTLSARGLTVYELTNYINYLAFHCRNHEYLPWIESTLRSGSMLRYVSTWKSMASASSIFSLLSCMFHMSTVTEMNNVDSMEKWYQAYRSHFITILDSEKVVPYYYYPLAHPFTLTFDLYWKTRLIQLLLPEPTTCSSKDSLRQHIPLTVDVLDTLCERVIQTRVSEPIKVESLKQWIHSLLYSSPTKEPTLEWDTSHRHYLIIPSLLQSEVTIQLFNNIHQDLVQQRAPSITNAMFIPFIKYKKNCPSVNVVLDHDRLQSLNQLIEKMEQTWTKKKKESDQGREDPLSSLYISKSEPIHVDTDQYTLHEYRNYIIEWTAWYKSLTNT